MPRLLGDWLAAYLEYTSATEAPTRMRFWCGVSAVAGALRRKVWFDMGTFRWYPNFYILLVAPPAVVSKSSTLGMAIDLLRQVPGIQFGPSISTWPKLVEKFAASTEAFEYPPGTWNTMSPLTMEASELGILLNPQDREMLDLYTHLWDGKQGEMSKETKTSGNDSVQNPWINLIAGTTPAWIAGSFPEYAIGQGFTSRCIFVYADKKAKRVAYPIDEIPADFLEQQARLIADLCEIAKISGPFPATPEAKKWGKEWYDRHYDNLPPALLDERFGGYLDRKQAHMHKLALVMVASKGRRVIDTEDLVVAYQMVTDLEADMVQVYGKIGRSEDSAHAERLLQYIRASGRVEWSEAFRHVHKHFPGIRDFENILAGLIRARLVIIEQNGSGHYLSPGKLG